MQAERESREGMRGERTKEKSTELLANVLKWRELVSPHDVFMLSCFFFHLLCSAFLPRGHQSPELCAWGRGACFRRTRRFLHQASLEQPAGNNIYMYIILLPIFGGKKVLKTHYFAFSNNLIIPKNATSVNPGLQISMPMEL